MKTKQPKTSQAKYSETLIELNVLNPTSEFATFKTIFNDAHTRGSSSKKVEIYTKFHDKVARNTPQLIKKLARKTSRVTKGIMIRTDAGKKYKKHILTTDEIQKALKTHSESPIVSIVIPVFNNIEYTKNCVSSLALLKTRYSFKVVIVDDKSTDETEQYFSSLENIHYIRNSENLGFLLSCNSAIKRVDTKYTVLLNNDTQVLEGWLDGLIDALELDDKVGLVGSKLIYGDNTLQEAGGIIFSDGNAWNYGNGQAPGDFEYNYKREVDYVTGASIAFNTSLFKKLGYFDETFAPAYYEDTDMAMQMRKNGYKVIYNPASSLIHFEGKTMGTDTGVGLKAYQRINKEKFYEKWKSVLKNNHYDGPEDILLARERGVTKHILVCDIHVPFPDKDAGSVRMHGILTCLKELGYQVTFWPDTHCPLDKYTVDLQEKGIEVAYGSKSFEDFIIQRAGLYDAVILSRPIVAPRYLPLIKFYSSQTKIIFDTVDLHYIRLARQAEVEENPEVASLAKKWKVIELGLIEQADTSLVVSGFEKEELKKESPKEDVEILTLIHTTKPDNRLKFEKRKNIMFIGSYSHLPNKDGLQWFIRDVWPLVLKKLPKVQLTIIGSNIPEDIFNEKVKNVVVAGFVEDPTSFFTDSRVFIAPLRFGAGVKGKIVQAMEYGLPVVTTKVGAEGMYLVDSKSAMVALDAADFSEKIYQLYSDKLLWDTVSSNSEKVLNDHFSREVAKKALKKIIY